MAAAARGFPETIPTDVVFRTGYGETGQRKRIENVQRSTETGRAEPESTEEYFLVLVCICMKWTEHVPTWFSNTFI